MNVKTKVRQIRGVRTLEAGPYSDSIRPWEIPPAGGPDRRGRCGGANPLRRIDEMPDPQHHTIIT